MSFYSILEIIQSSLVMNSVSKTCIFLNFGRNLWPHGLTRGWTGIADSNSAEGMDVSCECCAVFSLETLAQDPRDSEITDMRYVNLFTPLPLPCSALTEA
jgi:hypothetical protein